MDGNNPAPAQQTDVNTAPVAAADTQVPADDASSTSESQTDKQPEVTAATDPVDPRSSMYEPDTEADGNKPDGEQQPEGDGSTTDETQGEDESQSGDGKRDANSRIRELNAKYRASEQENAKLRDQIAGKINADNPEFDVNKAIQDGATPESARLDALEFNQAKSEYTAKLVELNTSLLQQTRDVERDYPFMDPDNAGRSDEEKRLAELVKGTWFEAADVKTSVDADGNEFVTQANIPLYDYVSKMADIYGLGKSLGESVGQKSTEKKLAAVEIPTSPVTTAKDTRDDANLSAAEYAQKYKLKAAQ